MAEEYYNNKIVTTDGDTLIDLTSDTATAGDVLEGRTLHLASGAPATGTYRPSDEIEARLEATVGHSTKNLMPITLESSVYTEGGANLAYTVDKAAGTITLNGTTRTSGAGYIVVFDDVNGDISGNVYVSGGYSDNCYVRVYDNSASPAGYVQNWDGAASRGSRGENDSDKEKLISGHRNAVRIRFTENQTFTNVVIRPMIRSGNISDDTFEPYQVPTDIQIKSEIKKVELSMGYDCPNIFYPVFRQGTVATTSTTTAVSSINVISTEVGKKHWFWHFDEKYVPRVYGLNQAGVNQLTSGVGVSQANRLYDSQDVRDLLFEHANYDENIVAYAVMIRKCHTVGQSDWENIDPAGIPSETIMVTDIPPLYKMKQDKPVELDPHVLTWNTDDLINQYAYLQFIFMDMQTTSSRLFDIATVPTSQFINLPVSQPSYVFGFSSIIALRAPGSTTGTSYITFYLNTDGTIDMSYTYTPLAQYLVQIIGIPK